MLLDKGIRVGLVDALDLLQALAGGAEVMRGQQAGRLFQIFLGCSQGLLETPACGLDVKPQLRGRFEASGLGYAMRRMRIHRQGTELAARAASPGTLLLQAGQRSACVRCRPRLPSQHIQQRSRPNLVIISTASEAMQSQ